MAKQRKTEGAVLEINIGNQYFIYAQILYKGRGYVFFDYRSKDRLTDLSILLEKKPLFIIMVYDEIITGGHWLKVGKLPIRKDLSVLPMKFIQDSFHPEHFELYDPNTGAITPTTKDHIIGLERASVWAQNHVEDRIRDYYNGVPTIYLKADRELFGTEFP